MYRIVTVSFALALAAGCSATQLAGTPPSQRAQPAKPAIETPFERWLATMQGLSKPTHACLTASYPEKQWRNVPCVMPPNDPLLPARGVTRATVGDGKDFSAVVAGHVSFAEGAFHDVTGVTSEYVVKRKRHIANAYSLQLNTQFFNTEACASLGSPDPATCFGWEQFAYDTTHPIGVFIEYWLVDFGPLGTTCPSSWHKYVFKTQGEVNCWINSPEIPTPVEPITALRKLRLVGAAAYDSRSQDFAQLIDGNKSLYYVGGQNWFPDLSSQWQVAEFNVLGDCCGDQAIFNPGSTIVVRTQVDSGTTAAPSCAVEGFAAESNNLHLTATPADWPTLQYPSIVFTETNAKHTKASCATAGS